MPKSRLIFGNYDTSNTNGKVYKLKPMNLPTPERQTESFEVKGRSGSLLIDYGSYNNVTLEAEVGLESKSNTDSTIKLYDDVRSAVMRQTGYQRLEDSDYPGEYRMARSVGVKLDVAGEKNGSATITFDAKPQRYLTSGDSSRLTVTPDPNRKLIQITYGKGTDIFNQAMQNLLGDAKNSYYVGIDLTNPDYAAADELLVFTSKPYDHKHVMLTYGGTPLAGDTYQNVFTYTTSSSVSVMQPRLEDTLGNRGDYLAFEVDDYFNNLLFYQQGNVYPIAYWYSGSGSLIPPDEIIAMAPLLKIETVGGSIYDPRAVLVYNNRRVGFLSQDPDVIIGLDIPSTLPGSGVTVDKVIIDSDTYNAYFIDSGGETHNLNQYVTITGNLEFPADTPYFDFNISRNITKLEVIPRWWKI